MGGGGEGGDICLTLQRFKDATAPQFGHSHVAFCLFLITKIDSHCLSPIISRNGICSNFDLKPNYSGPVIPNS